MVTFVKDSLERKTSGLFLQRFCGSVLGQSSYDVVFLSALAACSGEITLKLDFSLFLKKETLFLLKRIQILFYRNGLMKFFIQ